MNLIKCIRKIYAEFDKTIKNPIAYSPTIDDLIKYPAFLFTYTLVRLFPKIRPESIVLLGFLSNALGGYFIACGNLWPSAIFVFLKVILDNVDGQLARYKNQVSILGCLLDLASDFIGVVLLYYCIFLTLKNNGNNDTALLLLSLAGLVCNLVSSTQASFYSFIFHDKNNEALKDRFLYGPVILENSGNSNQAVEKFLKVIFNLTWKKISYIVAMYWSDAFYAKSRLLANVFGVGAVGSHLLILCVFLMAHISLFYYLFYQIALLALFYLMIFVANIRLRTT